MAMQTTAPQDGEPLSEINTTPLIDVMLVMLIMFIVTLPPQRHAVKIDTPTNSNQVVDPTQPIRLQVDYDGSLFWNGEAITLDQLDHRLVTASRQSAQLEIHIEPNRAASYGHVIHVMAAAQRDGLTRIGVVGGT